MTQVDSHLSTTSAARRRTLAHGLALCMATLAWLGAAHAPAFAGADRHARADMARQCRNVGAETVARTELFFGLSRPGGVISDEDFKNFLDVRVTPRFPDGLTLLSGSGQFRNASGVTIVEGSKLLILLYPARDASANAKIEQIRSDYKAQFQQESVLRVDELSCVSF
jgi:Protein of unknown function (DUF3574)